MREQRKDMENRDYTEVIARALSGELSEQEAEALEKWLQESPENRGLFAEYSRIWENMESLEPSHKPDVAIMWRDIEEKLGFTSHGLSPNRVARKWAFFSNRRFRGVGIATTLAAAALVLFFFYQILLVPHQQTIVTHKSEKRQVELPDHSLVYLNAETEITFPKEFSDTLRTVLLKGEAFFRVQPAPVPFEVRTQNATIRVLGTEFDVWARNSTTRVIVRSGRVRVASRLRDDSSPVVLSANQMSVVSSDQSPQPPEAVNANYLLGWLHNRFVFSKTPLKEVVSELERRYDIRIELADPELADRTISGSVEESNIDSTLKYICLTLNLSYQYDGEKYIIR